MTSRRPEASWIPTLLAIAVYVPTLNHGFVYDDPGLVASLDGGPPRLHRIVLWLSAWIDRQVWGDWATGFHATNVALHGSVTWLVTRFALRVAAPRVAIVAATLFAVLPVHADVVSTIVHRKEMLALGFGLAATFAWRSSGTSMARGVFAVGLFTLALLSKEASIVALPAVLWLISRYRVWRDDCRPSTWPLAGMASIGVLGAAASVGADASSRFTPSFIAPLHVWQLDNYGDVLVNVVDAVGRALWWATTGMGMVAEPALVSAVSGRSAAVLALSLLIVVVVCRRAQDLGRVFLVAAAWAVLLLLPAANVVPLTHFYLPPRYLYAASVGGCWFVALVVFARRPMSRSWILATSAVVVFLCARAVDRGRDWRSDDAVWTSAERGGQLSLRARQGLAARANERGNIAEAVRHLDDAASKVPLDRRRVDLGYDGHLHRDLALGLAVAGRSDDAGALGETLAAFFPTDVTAHLLAARAALARADDRIAHRHLSALDAARPNEPWTTVARILLLATSDVPDLRDPDRALDLATAWVAAHNEESADPGFLRVLAVAEAATGAFDDAIRTANRARRLALDDHRAAIAATLDGDLERYRVGKPARR